MTGLTADNNLDAITTTVLEKDHFAPKDYHPLKIMFHSFLITIFVNLRDTFFQTKITINSKNLPIDFSLITIKF